MGRINSFLQVLQEEAFIDEAQAGYLADKYSGQPRQLLYYLDKQGLVPKSKLVLLWADYLNIPWVDLSKTLYQNKVLEKFSQEFCTEHCCIPIYEMANTITLAMEDPVNLDTIEAAERLTQSHVSPVFAMADEIDDALSIQYNSINSIDGMMAKIDLNEFAVGNEDDSAQLEKDSHNESVIELSRVILLWAIKERASDIHIEPNEFNILIRFRVDGIMQKMLELEKPLLRPIMARLKVLAHADVVEKRLPLDGRINMQLKNDTFDFRFSTVPGIYGEKAVLRVLGQASKHDIPMLEEINLSSNHYHRIKHILKSPNGIFFVVGPTGSGKSTALFSMLQTLDREKLSIMTVENPVEYRMAGITQIEVNQDIGLGFSKVLRSLLRQDPDVILVGEIRDIESAKTAAEAALTGHFVMSTLHTNSAVQAVTRLIEVGVEPFLVAPAINGVMAQRLVRKLCMSCRVSYQLPAEQVQEIFIADEDEEVLCYKSKGCQECNNTGYKGRIAIHEVLEINETIRNLIARDTPSLEIQKVVENSGFDTLRYDGMKKVLRGLTTIDEIDRVTAADT